MGTRLVPAQKYTTEGQGGPAGQGSPGAAVRADDAAAGEMRINKMRLCRLMCGKALLSRANSCFV